MKIVEVYEAFESLDKEEGRGGRKSLGHFRQRADADRVAEGKGPQGGPGSVDTVRIVSNDGGRTGYKVLGSEVQVCQDVNDFLRQAALAKLSRAEREVLGLK